MRLTKNFNRDEFVCPCCRAFVDSLAFRAFVARLQYAREQAGIPFVITSGYRCAEHNKAVGGKGDSSHLKGLAADIRAQTSLERFKIIDGLIRAGLTRIGIAKTFIHVDISTDKPQRRMWVY